MEVEKAGHPWIQIVKNIVLYSIVLGFDPVEGAEGNKSDLHFRKISLAQVEEHGLKREQTKGKKTNLVVSKIQEEKNIGFLGRLMGLEKISINLEETDFHKQSHVNNYKEAVGFTNGSQISGSL